MKRSMIYKAVLAAMLVSSSPAAVAVGEVEFNAPIAAAQAVTLDGSVMIDAEISGPADVDYFSFQGRKDQKIRIDIDGGMKIDPSTGMVSGVDTTIALFGPGPVYKKWAENDDALALDEGSVHLGDSLIPEFMLPEDGVWTVGVSRRNGGFLDGGAFKPGPRPPAQTMGTYKLIVTDLVPPVQLVLIDVKPGNEDPSPVNPKAKGVIPVAILGSETFNVKEVDLDSLTFGSSGDEKTLRHCQKTYRDVNTDGFMDLVCHFENGDAGFSEVDLMGTVKGKKVDKKAFRGHGRLKVKPAERE